MEDLKMKMIGYLNIIINNDSHANLVKRVLKSKTEGELERIFNQAQGIIKRQRNGVLA